MALSVGVDMPVSTKPKIRPEHRNGFCMSMANPMNKISDEMEVTIASMKTMKNRLLLILCLYTTYQAVAALESTLLRNSVKSHQLAIMTDSTIMRHVEFESSKCTRALSLLMSLYLVIAQVCAHQPSPTK